MGTAEFKVGALVVIVAAIIGALSLKVTNGSSLFANNKTYWFEVQDASGLVPESGVRMAGIRVGLIRKIQLVLGRARVTLEIQSDVPLTQNAAVEIRADGILGDKHVELIPGIVGQVALEDGGQILNVSTKGSIDKVLADVSRITNSLSRLAETLNNATTKNGDGSTPVGRIILNIESLTEDLADVTANNKGKINDIISRVDNISETLDNMVNDDSDAGFRAAWANAVNSLKRIDTSLRNIEEITEKVNNGEGTIGRLINDGETVDKINTAVDNVNEFLGGATDLETSIDFHSEYLSASKFTKSYLGLRIQPGADRYYDIQIIDDPSGVTKTRNVTVEGTTTASTTETVTDKSDLKFTILFAKNFYNFTARGGIIESSGGVGLDYYLLDRKLKLTFEAFNFDNINVKSYVQYNFFKGVYIMGGGDHITSSTESGGFVGAGLFLTNEDLKMFASKLSF